jgi:hypothetical protein
LYKPNNTITNPLNSNYNTPPPATMEEFSPEQKYAFKRFKDGENLFVTGQAGREKRSH